MSELDELLTNPVFQNLLGKAETHEWEFRPKEAERLEAEGKLQSLLVQRTKACWDELRACRRSGMTQWEAEEVALPLILVPDETENPNENKEDLLELVQEDSKPNFDEAPKNSEEWIKRGMWLLDHNCNDPTF